MPKSGQYWSINSEWSIENFIGQFYSWIEILGQNLCSIY